MNIYVGNVTYGTTDTDLRLLFERFGEVESARIIMDRMTGRSKGFGFVEMPNDSEGQDAIDALDGTEQNGRQLKVSVAKPKTDNRGPRRY